MSINLSLDTINIDSSDCEYDISDSDNEILELIDIDYTFRLETKKEKCSFLKKIIKFFYYLFKIN